MSTTGTSRNDMMISAPRKLYFGTSQSLTFKTRALHQAFGKLIPRGGLSGDRLKDHPTLADLKLSLRLLSLFPSCDWMRREALLPHWAPATAIEFDALRAGPCSTTRHTCSTFLWRCIVTWLLKRTRRRMDPERRGA